MDPPQKKVRQEEKESVHTHSKWQKERKVYQIPFFCVHTLEIFILACKQAKNHNTYTQNLCLASLPMALLELSWCITSTYLCNQLNLCNYIKSNPHTFEKNLIKINLLYEM